MGIAGGNTGIVSQTIINIFPRENEKVLCDFHVNLCFYESAQLSVHRPICQVV